jgi:putative transposase
MVATNSKTREAWNVLFADLVARGLAGVRFMASDADRGLVEAIAANPPGALWQRSRTRCAANPTSTCPKSCWSAVKAMLHSVYDQPDVASVHAQYDKLPDQVTKPLPAVAEHLDAARAAGLAFTSFPKEIWRQILSNPTNDSTARSDAAPTS